MRVTFSGCVSVSNFAAIGAPYRRNVRREMDAFDELSPEARRRIAESPFGGEVQDLIAMVTRRGASRKVQERLKARNVMPCDVGTEGVVLEELTLLEEQERARIAGELAA